MEKNTKKLILIDGNALMHRAYHAIPPLTTKSGELVNAVYGFTSTVLSVIQKFKPEYIAATFDLAGPTFRHKDFTEYKAHRVKAPDEFYAQIPRVKEVVKTMNIPIFEKQGFEADDMIGTLATCAMNNPELETIIVTGDMDTLQLVNEKTKVFTLKRGISDTVTYDIEKVLERYGLEPKQIIDLKGIAGDPSDNIPGVKGIGEKGAINLLKEYGSVEGIYENIERIKGATKEKLTKDKANALLSKQLATIATNCDINFDLETMRVHDYDRENLVALFGELNFYSLVKRLPDPKNITEFPPLETSGKKSAVAKAKKTEQPVIKDFKFSVFKKEDYPELMDHIAATKIISLAVIPEGIGISWNIGRAYFLAFENFFTEIKNILEDENIAKVGYDLKQAYKLLWQSGIDMRGIEFDVMIAAYAINPGRKIEFDALILSELGEEVDFSEKKKGQLKMIQTEDDKQKLVCQKADYALKLKSILEKNISEIEKEQLEQKRVEGTVRFLFNKIEMPLVNILGDMELTGIQLNCLLFKGIVEKINHKIENLEKSIHELAGRDFNINSPYQLAYVLFVDLHLPTTDIKKGKTGYSTAAGELAKLRDKHKIIEKVEEYRELFKLKTTYLDTLPEMVDKESRLHTSFNQAVTATGRLSSVEPNLQNIPIRTELGQLMRTAFEAKDGYKLISADYSQIDLRCVAHVSEDKKMIEAFHRGDDIHTITASAIYKVAHSQVTDKMRRHAKALNFGIIYGMSAFGFSQSTGVEREEAKKFIDEYLENFSGVGKYMKETKEFARQYGFVETMLGRRRYIPEIHSPNFQVVSGAERMAINMPIQGLSADIVKLAMVKVADAYKDNPDVKMLLQIHDEIILEVKEEIANEVAGEVKKIMESVVNLRVPLVVDVKIGNNWGEI